MKNYAKIGSGKGKPAYRTPSSFRFGKYQSLSKIKTDRERIKKNRNAHLSGHRTGLGNLTL